MSIRKPKSLRSKADTAKSRRRARTAGIDAGDVTQIVNRIQAGFPFSHVVAFERASGLSRETVSRFVAIPQRTLTRRQTEGRLRPDESDRLLRASRIFERATDLFDGDVVAAREWLLTPQRALGGAVPLEFASLDIGAREVENLIGRLEHGVLA